MRLLRHAHGDEVDAKTLGQCSAPVRPGVLDVWARSGLSGGTAVDFSGLVVSVIAHTTYYGLVQRHEVNLLPLMSPTLLADIAQRVTITPDAFDARMGLTRSRVRWT
jgi:O-acetylserine/cysteine efflux transporter